MTSVILETCSVVVSSNDGTFVSMVETIVSAFSDEVLLPHADELIAIAHSASKNNFFFIPIPLFYYFIKMP